MSRRNKRPAAASFLVTVVCAGMVLCASGAASISSSQVKSEIKVKGPRPLAAAILVLEARLGVPITYEDPAYRFAGDIAVSPEGPVIPKPGSIEFAYPEQPQQDEIVHALVAANSAQGNPGIFEVRKEPGFYHVVPVKAKNENGELIAKTPILETRISVSASNVTGLDVIDLICKQVSQKLNENVVVGLIPPRPFSAMQQTYTCVDQPASDCLAELIKKSKYNLSWQLFYDPKLRWYVLNIHPVGYTGQSSQ